MNGRFVKRETKRALRDYLLKAFNGYLEIPKADEKTGAATAEDMMAYRNAMTEFLVETKADEVLEDFRVTNEETDVK